MNKIAATAIATLITAVVFNSCNDDMTTIGASILPDEDIITVYTDTFIMSSETVLLDSVFAKSTDLMLGEMYDPEYGKIKSDFICQFYCEDGFHFEPEPLNGVIDSVSLFLMYPNASWYGDSLTPMRVTVYPVVKPLKRNFYTNEAPEPYCDMSNPLATLAYTAHDMNISDSIRSLSSSDINYYTPHLRIVLPQEFGQKFYDETVNNPASFASQSAFTKFFPGFYITTTYGSGNMIKSYGEYIVLRMYYAFLTTGSYEQDTVVNTIQDFYVPKEVVQINRYVNSNIAPLLETHQGYTYIKSPAGVCTRLTIPTTKIAEKINIKERFINNFNLHLKFLPPTEWDFACYPPSYLLVLPEDSVKQFFEEERMEDDVTSYVSFDGSYASKYLTQSGYTYSNFTYYFGNVSLLLQEHIEKAPDRDLKLLVVPVTRSSTSNSSSYYYSSSYTYYTTGITNSLYMTGVKLRNDEENMKISVLSSKFEVRQ